MTAGPRIHQRGRRTRLSTYLSKTSPSRGRETNWLVTATHPDGVLFIVFTAPERDFERDERVFAQVLRSVRIAP